MGRVGQSSTAFETCCAIDGRVANWARMFLLNCLSQGMSVVPLLFADVDSIPETKARTLSRSLLDVLQQWIPVSESERPGRSFYSGYVDMCHAIAKAASVIAAADSRTPGDVLRAAMDESKLLKLSQSVSPLVPRPGRIAAVSARGWLAICALLAAAEPSFRSLLRDEDEFGSDLDTDMSAALTRTLASAKQLLIEKQNPKVDATTRARCRRGPRSRRS
jgi:hypothetical protein